VSGAGRGFCAGADMNRLQNYVDGKPVDATPPKPHELAGESENRCSVPAPLEGKREVAQRRSRLGTPRIAGASISHHGGRGYRYLMSYDRS